MKKAIIHIGCEKTGSTSIQNYISKYRDSLLKDHRILFPRSLGSANHTKFAIYACNQSRGLTRFLKEDQTLGSFRESLKEDFLKEIRSCSWSVLIISAEWLHPRIRSPEEFSRIKDFLDDIVDDIEILMYVRSQDEMAVSLYSTSVKAGNYDSFKFPSVASDNLPYYYDFFSIYKNWKAYFGVGNVKVKVFHQAHMCNGDVVKDFLNFLNIDLDSNTKVAVDNKSLSEEGLILLRSFNFWIDNSSNDISSDVKNNIKKQISENFRGKCELATEQERKEFYNFFSTSNNGLILEVKKDLGILLSGL